jgi:hypothetical protein
MKVSTLVLIVFFLLSTFFFNSCGQPKKAVSTNSPAANENSDSPTGLPSKLTTVKLKLPDEEPLTVTAALNYGKWTPMPMKNRDYEYYAQSYCLSNATETKGSSPKDEFLQICFIINDNKRWDSKSPVAPGNYYLATSGMAEMGRATGIKVSVTKGEQQFRDLLIDPSDTSGSLTIEKSSKEFISGKFALYGSTISITGEFGMNIFEARSY